MKRLTVGKPGFGHTATEALAHSQKEHLRRSLTRGIWIGLPISLAMWAGLYLALV